MKRHLAAVGLLLVFFGTSSFASEDGPNFELRKDREGPIYSTFFDYAWRLRIKYTDGDGTRVIITDVIINDDRKCFSGHYYRYYIPMTLGKDEAFWIPIDCRPYKIVIQTNKGPSVFGFAK